MTDQTSPTRRELRLAERAGRRRAHLPALVGLLAQLPPVGLRLRGDVLARLASPGLRLRHVDWAVELDHVRRLASRPEVVAVVCAAFLAGGVTQGQIEQGHRQEQRQLMAAAEQAHLDHVGRVLGAQEARLTGQATVFAAAKRSEALHIARTAVETAATVVQAASTVVAPEAISPLDTAKAQLAGLIATAPDPVDVLPRPVEPSVSTGPQHDGVTSPAPAATATATAGATAGTVAPASAAGQAAAASSADAASTVTDPVATVVDPAAPVPSVDARAASVARGSTVGRAQAPSAALRRPSAAEETPAPPQAPSARGPVTPLDALDVDTSLRMIAAAEEVIALSAQVQATTEATLAAAEAAARAAAEQAAAEAAARAAAQETAKRVAAVAEAPNGAVPRDLLCGVSFARGVELRCDAAKALEDLNVAFRARFGKDLRVVSSYRDYAAQVATKAARGSLAGAPGTSNHGLGLAVDLDGFGALGQFDLPTYRWMREHAGDHGWHHPSYMQPGGSGPLEPWHWEYGTQD